MTPAPRGYGVDAALITVGAVGSEVSLGAVDLWATGSVGMGAPLLGMVLGLSVLLSVWARRDRTWLTRDSLRLLAVRIGAGHFLAGGVLWAVQEGAVGWRLLVGTGAVGLLVGLSAALVTMCAGDAVAMVFCPFPEGGSGNPGGGPAGPWRRR